MRTTKNTEASLHPDRFSGPLDLLLHLLTEKKLEITDVALADITEQFLAYVETLEGERAVAIADFLVVASRLALLKARALLPQFASAAEDEGPSLEAQLRRYRAFAEASRLLNRRWMGGESGYARMASLQIEREFSPPALLSAAALCRAFRDIVARLAPPKPLPETRMDPAVSVKEKIARLRMLLARHKIMRFFELVDDRENRTDMIVSLLAVLEMARRSLVSLRQRELFGDIHIVRAS